VASRPLSSALRALPLLALGCGAGDKPAASDRGGGGGGGGRDSAPGEEGPGLARAPEDLVAFVGEPVRLDGSASEGEPLRWELGDGTTAEGAVVEHAYAAPGRYRVVLTAEGAPPHTDSLAVTVVHRPLAEAPFAAFELGFAGSYFSFFTLGGLRTSVDGEVLDRAGAAIPGLFAAGRTTSGLPASGYGYSSGLSLADCTFFGRRAGAKAAGSAAKE
jgi:hypothetical protein